MASAPELDPCISTEAAENVEIYLISSNHEARDGTELGGYRTHTGKLGRPHRVSCVVLKVMQDVEHRVTGPNSG